jgi:uncharacterized protein YaaN involved in tellurite resistance
MIHDRILANLFKKQADNNYKKLWVFHKYLKKTVKTTLTEDDKVVLKKTFDVSDTYLTDAITKVQYENSDEAKAKNKEYFMEQTFARGIQPKTFSRYMQND